MRDMAKLHVSGVVSVSAKTYKKLERAAKKQRKSVSLLVDQFINAALDKVGDEPRVDDESRCAFCQWPLAETLEKGCVRGNCSMRPLPTNYYAPERAARETADMIRGVNVGERGKEQP